MLNMFKFNAISKISLPISVFRKKQLKAHRVLANIPIRNTGLSVKTYINTEIFRVFIVFSQNQ